MAKQIAKYLYLWIGALSGATVVLLTILFINSMWTLHKPVVFPIEVTKPFIISDVAIEGWFIGKKLRECGRISNSEVGYYSDRDGVIHETTLTYINDNSPSSSFPPGVIDIGGIRWDKPVGVISEAVGFTISHTCDGALISSVFWFEVTL